MIQIHRLEGFYWVARAGGYHKAARAFPYPITQPAVHQQVKKLEAELGLALFEKVAGGKMQLTPAGRKLYDFCAPFFERMPAVVRAIQAGEYAGALRVHASPLVLRQLMPGWLSRLHKRHPELEIELRELMTAEIGILLRGDADLLIDYFAEVPDSVATMKVGTMRPFVVLPLGHPHAQRVRMSLASLVDETFISYTPGQPGFHEQMRVLAAHGLAPRQTLSCASADTILGFVESGLGFSIVPSLDPAGPRGRGVAAIPLVSPKVEGPVLAAWRKDTPENPLLDALLEVARV